MLKEDDRDTLREMFAGLVEDVAMLAFVDGEDCALCPETLELLGEVAAVSDRIELRVHDISADPDLAMRYGIDRAPALVVLGPGERDHGIRFFGIPAGYEAATIVHDLVHVSTGDTGLRAHTEEALRELPEEVTVKVFVTPTCPYCPGAAITAHRMALAAPGVRAEVYEVSEFPDIVDRYRVMGVPKVVVNDAVEFEGAAPEEDFLAAVQRAAGAPA